MQPPKLRRWHAAQTIERIGGATMGTAWSACIVRAPDIALAALEAGIADTLARVIAQMSTWDDGSDIVRFNRAPPGSVHKLPDELRTVLEHAMALAAETEGAYDPTAGALVDLWGFGPPGVVSEPPSPDAIAEVMKLCGWRKLAFDQRSARARQPGGMRLDLSSIAKGYAVDLLADCCEERGVQDYLVEIGGELRGAGVKPDGSPWWVALDTPMLETPQTVLALHGLAVATSGDSCRAFIAQGRRYSHTLDPRSGYPVPERLALVTVIDRRCMAADALATALTVLGPDDGFAFAARRGAAARFIMRDGNGFAERMTPAFAALLD